MADLSNSDSDKLAKLLAIDKSTQCVWRPEELGAILKHQMAAPVVFETAGLDLKLAAKIETLAASCGLLIKSFSDLLHHPSPPVELLRLTKDFAKAHLSHPDSPLPREIAQVLYFGSIVVAMMRTGKRISGLPDAAVRDGLEWAVSQSWMDEDTRGLLEEGVRFIDSLQ